MSSGAGTGPFWYQPGGGSTAVSAGQVLMEGVVFGESPRWRDGQLWFSDCGAHQVIALAPGGRHEVVATVESFPMCIGFLPDGRLLIVDSARRRLLRREPDGSLIEHAVLVQVSDKPWNDIVADGQGNAHVNTIGFDFPGGQLAPGLIVLVTADGTVSQVAGDLAFPNGMAITPDGATLWWPSPTRTGRRYRRRCAPARDRPCVTRRDARFRSCEVKLLSSPPASTI
jgi:sugar lactone lactonase YvrE